MISKADIRGVCGWLFGYFVVLHPLFYWLPAPSFHEALFHGIVGISVPIIWLLWRKSNDTY